MQTDYSNNNNMIKGIEDTINDAHLVRMMAVVVVIVVLLVIVVIIAVVYY